MKIIKIIFINILFLILLLGIFELILFFYYSNKEPNEKYHIGKIPYINLLTPDRFRPPVGVNYNKVIVSLSRMDEILHNKLYRDIKYGDIEAYSVIHRKKLPWSSRTFLEYLLAFDKYKDHPNLKPYRPGGERSDNPFSNFYWDHFKNENEDYLRGNYPEITEVLNVIHDQDGIAILSHPMMILKDYGDVAKIADLGFDGIEVFSNYHTDRDIEELLKIVKEKNMLFTIGSGIHGKDDLIHMNPLRYHYYMLSIGEEKLNTILAKAE